MQINSVFCAFDDAIMDLIPVPCFLKDADCDFKYVRCNEAFARLMRLRREDIIGRTDWDLLNAEAIANVRWHDHAAMAIDGPYEYKSPSYSPFGASSEPVRNWKRKLWGSDGHTLLLCVVGAFQSVSA